MMYAVHTLFSEITDLQDNKAIGTNIAFTPNRYRI
jgi:hypothetical protein